jgi:hypothetical protein
VNRETVGRAYSVREVAERRHLFCLPIRVSLLLASSSPLLQPFHDNARFNCSGFAHGTIWSVSGACETILVIFTFGVHAEMIGR